MIFLRFEEAYVFIKSLTIRKLYNSFLLRLSYLLSTTFNNYWHWGKPETLSVEPTNLCNLKCPECPSGNNQMTRSRLYLSEKQYRKVLEEYSPWLVNLQLFFQGEPFIHPKIYDYIQWATQKGIYTSTSSNGHFLTKDNCEKIITSGLKRIIISLDGTTQETYEKYRVGGSLDTVLTGITNMVQAKKRTRSKYPTITIQFVVFKTNQHEILQIKSLAKKLKVDHLQLKSAQIDDFKKGNPLIPELDKYSRYHLENDGLYSLKRKPHFKCKRIWMGSVISAQGNMLPCCFDKNADYKFDQKAEAKASIWKNNNAKNFRKQVWHNPKQLEMCQNCSEGLKL